MIQLFQHYTLEATIVLVFMLAVAIKQVFELVQFFKNKAESRFGTVQQHEQNLKAVADGMSKMQQELKIINDKVDNLIESDRDAIKSWIVMLYRKYKIDATDFDSMEMDLLERRYNHYKQQGGNSYIDNIMVELRQIYNKKEDNNASVQNG